MVIIKVRKGLRNNIMVSLLLGSSLAATTQVQASQRYPRGPNFSSSGRIIQGNHKRENEPVGLTKEELAMWAKMSSEERKEWLNERKKQQEKKQQEEARQERMRWEKATHDKNRQFNKKFHAENDRMIARCCQNTI
jgi:sRNA-binding protein